MNAAPSNDRRWLDEPRNVQKLIYALYALCGGLLIVDFLYHKHGHFGFEMWPEFHAVYGFLAFLFVVFVGTQLRKLVSRREDYYDAADEPEAVQPEDHLRG